MSKIVYDIDYKKLGALLLPNVLRKSLMAAFIRVCSCPLALLAREFGQFRASTDYQLSHTCQVCYLRGLLNDKFDPVLRRIEIGDVEAVEDLLLYRRSESRFVMVPRREQGAVIVGRRGFRAGGLDFTVRVPAALLGDSIYSEGRLQALVDSYKLVSKRYCIIYK